MTDYERIDRDRFTDLALEYRDEMLTSMGVVGVEHSASYSAPGEEIRRYPVNAPGAHPSFQQSIGATRRLMDVRDYQGESAIASSDDVGFMTIRETTGEAARYTSRTTALGWDTAPTPREIRLAEHLEAIEARDIAPEPPILRITAAEQLLQEIVPGDSYYDRDDLWVPAEDTSIGNVRAVERAVTALRLQPEETTNHLIRYSEDFESPHQYRLSAMGIIVDKYFDNYEDSLGSDSWHRVYIGLDLDEVEDASKEAMGYLTFEFEGEPYETSLVTIPELLRPEFVLDLPAPEPTAPPEE